MTCAPQLSTPCSYNRSKRRDPNIRYCCETTQNRLKARALTVMMWPSDSCSSLMGMPTPLADVMLPRRCPPPACHVQKTCSRGF